jgi:hypothetical protein
VYALAEEFGIEVLDAHPITYSRNGVTIDGVHYVGIVGRTYTNMLLNMICN